MIYVTIIRYQIEVLFDMNEKVEREEMSVYTYPIIIVIRVFGVILYWVDFNK